MGFVLPELAGTPIAPRRFTSTYFDTADLLLASQGITLRRRVQNRKGLWQLKLPRGVARLEVEEPGGPLHPPGPILSLLTAALRGSEVTAMATIRTLRTGIVVEEGERRIAEVVYDRAQVLQGGRISNRFSEIEIELLEGDEADLKSIESALRQAGAWVGDQRPKAFRALNLTPIKPGAQRRPTTELGQLQTALSEQFAQIVHCDPGTRMGTDPEFLHQHRVAIRRLRSLLWAAGGLLDPDWSRTLRTELEWIGDQMNPVRDLDVMIPYLKADLLTLEPDEQAELAGFIEGLEKEQQAAGIEMIRALEDARYLSLLQILEEATRSLKVRPEGACFRDGAVKAFRRMRKAADSMQDPPQDDQMHLVRRLAKKSRYSAEVLREVGGKPVANYLDALKDLQQVLGDLQDAAVAEERIRLHLQSVEELKAAFALGRMVELQAFKKQRCRRQFPDLWETVERAGRKAWT